MRLLQLHVLKKIAKKFIFLDKCYDEKSDQILLRPIKLPILSYCIRYFASKNSVPHTDHIQKHICRFTDKEIKNFLVPEGVDESSVYLEHSLLAPRQIQEVWAIETTFLDHENA